MRYPDVRALLYDDHDEATQGDTGSRIGSTGASDALVKGRWMILDSLLALGLVLATATQLRFGDTPFGPGEMCLFLWLGLCLCLRAGRPAPASNPALTRVGAFWLILIVAESVGAIRGFATEPFFDTSHILHDVFAYSFLFVLACTMALELTYPSAEALNYP